MYVQKKLVVREKHSLKEHNRTIKEVVFSPTAECFGVSAGHIALRGDSGATARILFLPSLIRLGFQSWNQGLKPTAAGSGNQGSGQGSGNPGFREPGFGARFQEPKVPQTRLSSKVLGTMGSGYLLGSGTSRFRDPQVLGARKVPGTLGFRQGSGNLTMVSSSQSLDCAKVLESPEHQF